MNAFQGDNLKRAVQPWQNRWLAWIILVCALGILVLTVTALLTSRAQKQPAYSYSPALREHDPIAAVVDDSAIYQSDIVIMAQAQRLIDNGAELVAGSPLYETVLQELIDQRLLTQEAEAQKLDENTEVRHRMQLARGRILSDAAIDKVLQEATSDEALQAVFKSQAATRYSGPQLLARQIVVPDHETAVYVVKLLDEGQSFTSLAVAYSVDRASRENGGNLGYISKDMLDPVLTEIAFATETGKRAEIFETEQGWHVLEVIDRRDTPQPSFDDVKDELARLVGAQALQLHIKHLRQSSSIVINDPLTGPPPTPHEGLRLDPQISPPEDTP